MCDQIEFSNVILLNKVDLVKDRKQVEEITKVIKKFNPDAEVITMVARHFKAPERKALAKGGFTIEYTQFDWDVNGPDEK